MSQSPNPSQGYTSTTESTEKTHTKPKTVSMDDLYMYGSEVRMAFAEGYSANDQMQFQEEPQKAIDRLASRFIKTILGDLSKPITKERDREAFEIANRLIYALKTKTSMKIFVASQTLNVFEKYYPETTSRPMWDEGAEDIVAAIKTKFPFLIESGKLSPLAPEKYSNLGFVMGVLKDVTRVYEEFLQEEAIKESRILRLIANNWKGTQSKVIDAVISEFGKFKTKYEKESFGNIDITLLEMLLGFPEGGRIDIAKWYREKYLHTQTNPQDILKDFMTNVWPKMTRSERNRSTDLSEEERLAYLSKIKEMGIGDADCLCDLPSESKNKGCVAALQQKAPEANESSNTSRSSTALHIDKNKDSSKNKFLTLLEVILQQIIRKLASKPHICPNCFETHELLACQEIDSHAQNNIAGWITKDYEKQTNAQRTPYMTNAANRIVSWKKKSFYASTTNTTLIKLFMYEKTMAQNYLAYETS